MMAKKALFLLLIIFSGCRVGRPANPDMEIEPSLWLTLIVNEEMGPGGDIIFICNSVQPANHVIVKDIFFLQKEITLQYDHISTQNKARLLSKIYCMAAVTDVIIE